MYLKLFIMDPWVDSLKMQLYFLCDCYSFGKLVDLWLFITTFTGEVSAIKIVLNNFCCLGRFSY